jgi:hypothetical protein
MHEPSVVDPLKTHTALKYGEGVDGDRNRDRRAASEIYYYYYYYYFYY